MIEILIKSNDSKPPGGKSDPEIPMSLKLKNFFTVFPLDKHCPRFSYVIYYNESFTCWWSISCKLMAALSYFLSFEILPVHTSEICSATFGVTSEMEETTRNASYRFPQKYRRFASCSSKWVWYKGAARCTYWHCAAVPTSCQFSFHHQSSDVATAINYAIFFLCPTIHAVHHSILFQSLPN